jgi:hypothetical protein
VAKKLVIPVFASEAEDVAWHEAHWKEIEDEMVRQMKAGTAIVVGKGEPMPNRSGLSPVCIRLSRRDIEKARKLAAEEGMGYQTYIRMLLHHALLRKSAHR